MELRIKTIEIKKIGCIDALTIKPEIMTTIEGRNGTGKSTILAALKSVKDAGHDPYLLQKGAEEGSVKIVLSDGVSITETITPTKTTRIVRHPKMGKISRTKEWIESIIDSVSFDPARFLTARPAERLQIFMEALPLRLTAEQLSFLDPEDLSGIDYEKDHALTIIGSRSEGIYSRLYATRTEYNRTAKDKRATISELEKTLLPGTEEDLRAVLMELTEKLQSLQDGTTARIKRENDVRNAIEKDEQTKFSERKLALFTEMNSSANSIGQDYDQQIKALERERDAAIAKLEADSRIEEERCRKQRDDMIRAAADQERRELAAIQADYEPKLQAITEARGKALRDVEQRAKDLATRDLIDRTASAATLAENHADDLTAKMKRLDDLKASLLSHLPIKGVEITQGDIFVEGIQFDHVNDSEKHNIAVKVMRLNHGELGIMILDRAEVFDTASWGAFKGACVAEGIPIIAARVTDSDLTINAEGGATE